MTKLTCVDCGKKVDKLSICVTENYDFLCETCYSKRLEEKIQEADNAMKDIMEGVIRDVRPHIVRLRKKYDKETEKKEQRKNNRRVAPVYPVSDVLLKFMELDEGTEVACIQAVSAVTKYIKENNLNSGTMVYDPKTGQQKEDKRYWKPDATMLELFPGLNKVDYVHFNLIMGLLNKFFEEGKKIKAARIIQKAWTKYWEKKVKAARIIQKAWNNYWYKPYYDKEGKIRARYFDKQYTEFKDELAQRKKKSSSNEKI